MKRKRNISVIILLWLMLLLIACTVEEPKENTSKDGLSVFVGNAGNAQTYLKAIEEQFPDVELDVTYYTGPNTTEYMNQLMEHGEVPDLVFATSFWTEEVQKKYLLNLSGYSFVNNYNVSFLNKNEIDGQIFLLPAYYNLSAFFYNKTLFQENDWSVPQNQEEMLALVTRIRRDTDIIPIAFTGAYTGSYFRMMTSMAQAGFLTTPEGKQWEAEFALGNASAKEGFGEGLELMQELCEANAFDLSSEMNKDPDTYTQLVERQAAIIMPISGQSDFAEMMDESQDEFGTIPFFGPEEGDVMLSFSAPIHFGLGKQLGEAGNEKKLAQAIQIMEYFSTEQGQQAIASGVADVSPLAETAEGGGFALYQDIWHYVESGNIESFLYSGYEDVVVSGGNAVKAMMFQGGTVEEAIAIMDETRQITLKNPEDGSLASMEKDYTEEETVQCMADFLLAEGGGDVAIVSAGGCNQGVYNKNGVSGKLFKGDITMKNYNCVIPGGATANIVNVTMTGEEIDKLIKTGRIVTGENGDSGVFPYYISGAKVDDLENTREYQVTMASTDFDDSVYTNVQDTGILVIEAYLNYLKEK